ncbi:MAG TPA: protealysin inhibitor emfourin [Rhodocyclaceae bacterium]|nr:protealysin inhibitor emfourin [Rhodocyclaceae bacterium]
MKPEDRLEIEKLGGFAGFGQPGSRLRCRAVVTGVELTDEERGTIAALFASPGHAPGVGADAFRYRLTLSCGADCRKIEVGEDDLPASLQTRLQDELI